MAIIPSALSPISNSIDNIFPDKYLVRMQEMLIRSGMYIKASDILTLIFGAGIFLGIIALIAFLLLGADPLIGFIIGLIAPATLIFTWIFFYDGTPS
ncbi:hypothetical protein [Methanobacterium sp. MZ-A1]|uniref:hypothetical protein n=1 Tax=Methanobacterium sp. MZ-A1 TaxID=1911685 RepID=UPI001E45F3D6|nr:hypothetical protein [Methanobacterium sp. MZ-A1]